MQDLDFVDAEALAGLIGTDGLVLVAFLATWNRRCKAFAPGFAALARAGAAAQPAVTMVAVDVDESIELNSQYQVCSIPTLLLLHCGRELNRQAGTDLDAVKRWLRAAQVSGLG